MAIMQVSKNASIFTLLISSGMLLAYQDRANAQQSTVSAEEFLGQFADSSGNPISGASDPTTVLYRRGTDPLTQIFRKDGTTPITLDDIDDLTGTFTIAARPGGGTDVAIDLIGLLSDETYSFWAGYWPPPGFPNGDHLAFGAITTAGDGSDNWIDADSQGELSLNLVQQEGPMTLDGSASTYAPISPIVDLNGDVAEHGGYAIGVALHFGNHPLPPINNPGPIDTWVLHTAVEFEPIPEPSSIVLALSGLATCGIVVRHRRKR